MATRKTTWTPDIVRERIRTSALVRRLTKHVFGKVELTATQVTSALGLLKKTLPDLSATEFTGELKFRDVSDKPLTAEEWETSYGGVETPSGTTESVN